MELVKIDKQGRIVIPINIRKALGILGDTEAIIKIDGNKIIIEPVAKNLDKSVEEWAERILEMHLKLFSEDVEEGWKWLSYEYAERKLGISRRSS